MPVAWLTTRLHLILALFSVPLLPLPTLGGDGYRSVIARQEAEVLRFLRAFERVQEQLHPAKFTQLQADLSQTAGELFVRLRLS